jgi:hypothetical protein
LAKYLRLLSGNHKDNTNFKIGGIMLRKITFFGFLLILLVNPLFAQYGRTVERTGGYARVLSLGNNPYITDPYFISANPAWSAKFTNFVYGDIGSSSGANFGPGGNGQFLGANFNLNSNLTLGGYLVRNDYNGMGIGNLDPFDIVDQVNSVGGGLQVTDLDNNLVFLAAYTKGNHNFGFAISYASTISEDNMANGNNFSSSAGQIGISAGYLGRLAGNLTLDAALNFLFPSATVERPNVNDTEYSQTIINLNARMFINFSSKVALVPIFTLLNSSGTAEIGDADGVTSTDLLSHSVMRIGAGFVYSIADFLFSGGLMYESIGTTEPEEPGVSPDLESSVSSFPAWNLGAEYYVLDWLAARAGYSVRTTQTVVETQASQTEKNEMIRTGFDPDNGGFTLGLGFRLGGFSLDATVNEDVLRQGLNNIGGGGATFGYISASFAF